MTTKVLWLKWTQTFTPVALGSFFTWDKLSFRIVCYKMIVIANIRMFRVLVINKRSLSLASRSSIFVHIYLVNDPICCVVFLEFVARRPLRSVCGGPRCMLVTAHNPHTTNPSPMSAR